MKKSLKDFCVASLMPIQRGAWTFKVSANNYEEGVLILATNDIFGYTSLKYFVNASEGREWVNTLVTYTDEILRIEVEKMKSEHLKKH